MPDPNSPEARQEALRQRLESGLSLSLTALAEEFGVSVDSARRDLKALESRGLARCIRGGALPPQPLARATLDRLPETDHSALVTAALDAGVSLRDVQDGAGHRDPRTTRRYDSSRHNLDRHPSYAVSTFYAAGQSTDTTGRGGS